jgi:Fe-S cluster assembly protein SufD
MTAIISKDLVADREMWKYTPVDEVLASRGDAVPGMAVPIGRARIDVLAGELECPRLTFVNGIHVPSLSSFPLPFGLDFTDDDTLVVSSDVVVPTPIHLVHVSVPGHDRTLSTPRTELVVGRHSRVAVVESYVGIDGAAHTDASTTIRVESNGTLGYTRVQSEPTSAVHVGRTIVEQAEGSSTRVTSITTGADIARHELTVRLAGNDARAHLDGLYLPTGNQRHDNVVTVDHQGSRGASTQCFKGVIGDHARGSFTGRVIVRAETSGNDASQTNRNLVLSASAEADTRPWLEIFADDVRCTHGATVGRLDDDALFYLRSRGISVAVGRRMLVDAFIREILDTIEPSALRRRLADTCRVRVDR